MECCQNIKKSGRTADIDGCCSACPHKEDPEYMNILQALRFIAKKLKERETNDR